MYHLGIVQHLIRPNGSVKSSDDSTQAVIRMWDENLLMILVDKKLGPKIKEKDYVIADYTPITADSPNRKMVIVKVLPAEKGKKMWRDFEKELERKKTRLQEMKGQQQSYPYIR
ncbi:MAG: hypothetical protein ABII71_04830 [Candidatus Micrarchaeota archaeon]